MNDRKKPQETRILRQEDTNRYIRHYLYAPWRRSFDKGFRRWDLITMFVTIGKFCCCFWLRPPTQFHSSIWIINLNTFSFPICQRWHMWISRTIFPSHSKHAQVHRYVKERERVHRVNGLLGIFKIYRSLFKVHSQRNDECFVDLSAMLCSLAKSILQSISIIYSLYSTWSSWHSFIQHLFSTHTHVQRHWLIHIQIH